MVQQIMSGLSGVAIEEEKISVITKAVLVYWNVMVVTVHRHLIAEAFNANGTGRQVYELRKQMQDLKIYVSLFS
jgi:hypothetical protein